MRWLIIAWLLLSSVICILAPFQVASDTSQCIAMLGNAEDTYLTGPFTAEQLEARSQLHLVCSEFCSMGASRWTIAGNSVAIWAGIVAIYSSYVLIARKENAARFGLVALGVLLTVTITATLLYELHYRGKVDSMIKTTFNSIAVLSGNPVEVGPEPEPALVPLPVAAGIATGIDMALFMLLYRKRKTILAVKTPRRKQPAKTLQPAKALHCVTMNR